VEKELIKLDERKGYPMYCKASKVDKNNEVVIDCVVDGDTTTIVPGQHEVGCGFVGLMKVDVLEILEERTARGEHDIPNPVFYRIKGKVISSMQAK